MLIANKPTDPSEMQGAIATHNCEKVQLACTRMGYRCESVFIGGRVFSDCGEAGRISNDEHRCTRMHTDGLSV
ncbi:hypothetical protein [Fischerella thermalis]|uniref:hypothetical protein n=1 Tax=Fischerella thermalis TaxID=372787 RepID=UPI00103D5D26|nr:hypothetical protein [Fischerella thermalis]